jgi:hypothetical protein
MSSSENAGCFTHVQSDYATLDRCSLRSINGVESLTTKAGTNLVNIADGLHESLMKFQTVLTDLTDRIKRLENASATAPALPTDLLDRISRLEAKAPVPGPKGDKGDKGDVGDSGRDGLQGARGPKVDQLRDIKDINLDGLCDGAILVYSEAKKQFLVQMTE